MGVTARKPNPTQYHNPYEIENFTGTPQTPQQIQSAFLNSQILEYNIAQPNIFKVPASNYEYLASCNANKTNATLQDSIFGTIQSIYGTTNTVAITPQNNASYKNYRSNVYSNYFDNSKYVDGPTINSRTLSNTESRKQLTSPFSRIYDFIVAGSRPPQQIIDGQNFCENFNSLSNNVEQYYLNTYLPRASRDKYRCGFIYNSNYLSNGVRVPVFRGHLGFAPIDNNGNIAEGIPQNLYNTDILDSSINPGSQFFWNMNDTNGQMGARNAFLKYYCQMKVPACSNLDSHNIANPNLTCAWSESLGHAIPSAFIPNNYNGMYPGVGVNNNFANGYYRNAGMNQYPIEYYDNNSHVTTNSGSCRNPVDIGGDTPPLDLPTNCYTNGIPQSGNNLSINCVNSLLSKTGCSDGSLHREINNGGTVQEQYGLTDNQSFTRYNQVYFPADTKLNSIFKEDTYDAFKAQEDLFKLKSNAIKTDYNSQTYAARDLCLVNDFYRTFDFCTEYRPSTTPPFRLECVQQYFRTQGGQKTGRRYPTTGNLPEYNALGNWSQVTRVIDEMLEDTQGTDLNKQAIAFNDFYGIQAQQFTAQYIPSVPGIEVFWFTLKNGAGGTYELNVFLGRRIQLDLSLNNSGLSTGPIQFISFFNLKTVNRNDTSVTYRFIHTDGLQILKNKNIDTTTSTVPLRSYSSWLTQNSKTTASPECWPISAAKPNYFTISWFSQTGTGSFRQDEFKTCDPSPSIVNEGGPIMTMSQEEDAPMISFEVIPDPTDIQISFFSSEKMINYKFGDARLWKVMRIGENGVLPAPNTANKFGFSNRYLDQARVAGVQNLQTNDYTYLYGSQNFTNDIVTTTNVIIDDQSWRTITMLFETGSLSEIPTGDTHYILVYGELKLGIKRTGSIYNFVVYYKDNFVGEINTILPNTRYYLILIQDFDTSNQTDFTTKLRVSCSEFELFKSNTHFPFIEDNIYITRIIGTNGLPLWSLTDKSRYQISIGGTNGGAARTVGMNVAWLRFFDYVFERTDITKDLTNNWNRNWWNMI